MAPDPRFCWERTAAPGILLVAELFSFQTRGHPPPHYPSIQTPRSTFSADRRMNSLTAAALNRVRFACPCGSAREAVESRQFQRALTMHTVKFVSWHEGDAWIGYLQ